MSGPLRVYGQWSHYHVRVFTDQLGNEAIPFLLSGLIDLYSKKYTIIAVYLLLIYGYMYAGEMQIKIQIHKYDFKFIRNIQYASNKICLYLSGFLQLPQLKYHAIFT